MARGVDGGVRQGGDALAGHGLKFGQPLDRVAEKFDADAVFARGRRENIDHIAAHAEFVALEGDVVALIVVCDQSFDKVVAFQLHIGAQGDDHFAVKARVAETVDARDA